MKTRIFFQLVAVVAICFGTRTVHAQYPGQIPNGMVQVQPVMMPSSPFAAGGYASDASAFRPPAQVIPVGYQTYDQGKGGKDGAHHHLEFYGEFLYLRARDSEVAYAVPFNGPVVGAATPVQVGPIGVLDMDFQPSFRVGVNKIINDFTRISAEYTMYESGTTGRVVATPTDVVASLVSHPSTATAAQSFLQADGQYDISMDIFDVDVRRLFINECDLKIGWVLGIRAAQQEQNMAVNFSGAGTETVTTDLDFTGVGLKFGFDGEMNLGNRWFGYANMSGSLIPGQFSADYNQSQSYDAEVVNTGWKAGRIVTIWDLELGVSRVSKCGNYRVNLGYMFSAWTNTVQTDEWIQGVQNNSYIDMDSTMTLDGLVARVEARF